MTSKVTRRHFFGAASSAFAVLTCGTACQGTDQGRGSGTRISARPRTGVNTTGARSRPLGLDATRDAILQLPSKASDMALPLLVLLHGAGGSGAGILKRLGAFADEAGIAVLSPDSRGSTWDAIRRDFGPDVAFISRALDRVFETTNVDPARVIAGGFSDGASYAISIGLQNGDLFRRVLAYSPGFYVAPTTQGKPRFFLSHGMADEILPIDRCSRVIVPRLQKGGYDVTFREFAGGHDIPPDVARAGMRWAAQA